MGLWKRIFRKHGYAGTETACSGRQDNVIMADDVFAVGQEDSVFVSLEVDGRVYPLCGFELGCGLVGFAPYDKPDVLCDNAIVLIVESVRDESPLLGWALGRGHARNGRIVWRTDEDSCSSLHESVVFEDAVCGKYIKKYDSSLRCEVIEIRLKPKMIRIGDSYIQRKCKL